MNNVTYTDARGTPMDTMNIVECTMLPNGMVRFSLEPEGEIMLRRPKIGELREMREMLHAANDKAAVRSRDLQQQGETTRRLLTAKIERIERQITEALAADEIDEGLVESLIAQKSQLNADASREDVTAGRELNEWMEQQRVEWFLATLERLAIKPLPEGVEPPPFALDATFSTELVGHWRSRPSRSGG